mgnify:CR=1 FL=1
MSDSASLQKLSWLAVGFWDMREGMEKRGKELSEDLRDLTEELLVEPDLVLAKKWFDRDLLFVILPGLPFLCLLLGWSGPALVSREDSSGSMISF